MKEIKLGDKTIYIDESEIDESSEDIIKKEIDLEKTQEIEPIDDKLGNTLTNILGDYNE